MAVRASFVDWSLYWRPISRQIDGAKVSGTLGESSVLELLGVYIKYV